MFARVSRLALLCVALFVLASCAATTRGIDPEPNELWWPISLAVDPQGDYLYVVNSNFDLKFNTGTVMAIDLRTHKIASKSIVRIGSFGGDLVLLNKLVDGKLQATRGFVPIRDARTLTWFDISRDATTNEPRFNCSLATTELDEDEIQRCEDKYVLKKTEVFEDLGADIFAAAVGKVDGVNYLFTGSLRDTLCLNSGATCSKVSAFAIDGQDTKLIAQQDFVIGIHGIAVSPLTGELYVTSRFFDQIQTMKLEKDSTSPSGWELNVTSTFGVGNAGNSGDFARQIIFNQRGSRAFLAHRNPSSLVVLDTSLAPNGRARNRIIEIVELGSDPSDVKLVFNKKLQRELAYVICFGTNELWVVDTVLLSVVERLKLRKGPFKLAIVDNPTLGLKRAYITNFEENSITILELDEDSPFYHQEIASIN